MQVFLSNYRDADCCLDILKYEYMTQLLLDANYLPLVLKLFAHQDVDRAVDQKNDREDLEYVLFSCHAILHN